METTTRPGSVSKMAEAMIEQRGRDMTEEQRALVREMIACLTRAGRNVSQRVAGHVTAAVKVAA